MPRAALALALDLASQATSHRPTSDGPQALGRVRPSLEGGEAMSEEALALAAERHARIAARAEAMARELRAEGELGHLLARRAAVLADRMEALAHHDLSAAARDEADACVAFDQAHADEVARHRQALEADAAHPADPTSLVDLVTSLAALEADPVGLPHLQRAWDDLAGALRVAGLGADSTLVARATRWLRATPGSIPRERLALRVDAERARLREQADRVGPAAEVLSLARAEAGILARFNPAPARCAARQHEAAAERGFFRVLKVLADLRSTGATRSLDPLPTPAPIPAASGHSPSAAPPSTPSTPAARPGLTPPADPPAQLGSFCGRGGATPPVPLAAGPSPTLPPRATPSLVAPIGSDRGRDPGRRGW